MRVFAALGFLTLSVAAFAADTPPPPMKPSLLRGTVEMFDGKVLAIRTENGQDVMAAVSDKTRFATVERRNFDQLKPTDFVGITAVPGRNGHLRAEEVHIIPFVGLGEGHYPWDHHPGGNTMSTMGSMTNGTVAPAAAAGSMTNGTVMAGGRAHELHVTYRGAGLVNGQCAGRAIPGQTGCTGTAIVDVPSSAPIAAIVGGTPSDVKPGLAIVAGVLTDADGHVFLASATVEKNGVKPEF